MANPNDTTVMNPSEATRKQVEAENRAARGDNQDSLQGRTPSNAAGQPNIDPTQNNARPLGERPKATVRNEFKLLDGAAGSDPNGRHFKVAEAFSYLLQELEGQMTGSPEHREMVDALRVAYFWAIAAGGGGGAVGTSGGQANAPR